MRIASSVVAAVVLVACGGGGGTDAGAPGDGAVDAPRADASGGCTSDTDCSDGLFCNGAEICQPGGTGADPRGCVPSPVPPCMTGRLCNEVHRACETDCGAHSDADGDGVPAVECGGADCDDGDAHRFPANAEVCDLMNHDEDCDASTFGMRDGDGDGYADGRCCNASATGTLACGPDCDDGNSTIHPTQAEVCNHRDDDCNGVVDDGAQVPGFADMDDDLHGDMAHAVMDCPGAAHFSTIGDDCDDADPARHPAQPEICDSKDNDCNGAVDDNTHAVTWYLDGDGDGFGSGTSGTMISCAPLPGYSLIGTDCDDTRIGVSPGAVESCDGRDDDCNGLADFEISAGNYEDDDGDGHIDMACPRVGDDCDDFDPSTYPTATELCDGRDNDCDGVADTGTAMGQWYIDADGDSYGDPSQPAIMSCSPQVGRVPRGNDCDDSSAAVHPGAADPCNGHDDNCNADIDEDSFRVAFYRDADSDGSGTGSPIFACIAPPGDVSLPGDCNDTNAMIGPLTPETCNGVDDNCNSMIDEGVIQTFYPDLDHDGVGVMSTTTRMGCTAPAGFGVGTNDCDDTNPARHPGATEICDGIDNDCNMMIDEEPAASASCAVAHGAGSCSPTLHTCTVGSCDAAHRDCDGAALDGCEVDVTTSAANCGMCGHACNPGDQCTASACDMSPVVRIELGDGISCALRANGGLACWGDGAANSNLGDGASSVASSPRAILIGLGGVADVAPGGRHGCAALRSGVALCWGLNNYGEIGDGTMSDRPSPTPVTGMLDVVRVGVGQYHSCAVHRTGTVSCWGINSNGESGDGTVSTTPHTTPVDVVGVSGATDVSCASSSCCALLGTGGVMCWGYNSSGELGDGTTTRRPTAVPVSGLTDAVEISSVYDDGHVCARRTGGTVVCWGYNNFGELGDGTTTSRSTPVSVAGVSGAVQVAAGFGHGCVRDAAGAVSCWGFNDYGQTGRGTMVASPLPLAPVTGLGAAVWVGAGQSHACAAMPSGGVMCWGRDQAGQCGDAMLIAQHLTAVAAVNLP